mmetsp:Transcript_7702/g.15467  ORF Transcript_7702/g.15467 Transcript_7702/m.15467 type:complete len:407 (-) Transcript_7702:1556-2776(-)|eukprot:CAMPEP_0118804932 /NCGR_PEP_ID=MMETSP1161-20130426/25251_1 /TAXON_ID=249345 /ORGANISM="Picochlorum oklahomensis, Strain CCMP2329" /LENGTH=406 /DNA_ID=CAMNT_0006733787 /DNA_START=710 /DNA_END=1930 /DNA_ORIENTATION=+
MEGIVKDSLVRMGYDREANDVVQVLLREHPKSFTRCHVEPYTFENGEEERLVKLLGGVSIEYKGEGYRLPAVVFLPKDFPIMAPIVYMNPNESMVRNPKCPYVDANFRVKTEYLDAWNYPFVSLSDMYEDLKQRFSQAPPLRNNSSARKERHYRDSGRVRQEDGSSQHAAYHHPDVMAAEEAMRKSLAIQFHHALQDILIVDYRHEEEVGRDVLEKNRALQSTMKTLHEEQRALDDCISELASTIRKLDVWLEREEHKSRDVKRVSRGKVDAYSAIVPVDDCLQDVLESEACMKAVNDAVVLLDNALSESRISWKEYKRMISQLANYKFQAKVLNLKAYEGRFESTVGQPSSSRPNDLDIPDLCIPSYPRIEGAESLGAPSPPTSDQVDEENPLLEAAARLVREGC